jgi:nucleotide-binding universal stress UspA family protein
MRVLVPVEGTERDAEALRYASWLARKPTDSVVLVAVGELPESRRHAEELRRSLQQTLNGARARINVGSVFTTIQTCGDPAEGILDAAREFLPDTIVMFEHRHGRLTRFGHRHVVDHVRARASVPVEVVALDAACLLVVEGPAEPPRAERPIASTPASRAPRISLDDRCRLWTSLRTRAGGGSARPSGEPEVYLFFPGAGWIVGLPDESAERFDELDRPSVEILDSDVEGLGLEPADLAEGVAICRTSSEGTAPGWSCRPITLVGLDERGEHRLDRPAALASWLGN